MPAPVEALARKVLRQDLKIRRGESVIIESWNHTLPYVPAFVEEARRLGAQPTVFFEDERAWWSAVSSRHYRPFEHLSAAERAAVAKAGAYLFFWGPTDMQRVARLPEPASSKVVGYNDEWYAAAREGPLRGYRMTLGLASDPAAARFGLSAKTWRDRIIEAGMADIRSMAKKGVLVARRLSRGRELRVRHPNGTDLRVRLRGVRPQVRSGVIDAATRRRPFGVLADNPTGQVLAATDGSVAQGIFVGNRTVYNFFTGLKTSNARWTFERGRLTEHRFAQGGPAFERAYRAAPQGRDRLSFLSVGLNPYGRDVPPCEDTEEGALLLGIGGNVAFGGKAKMMFQAHAMVAGATVEVDGVPLAKGGRIL